MTDYSAAIRPTRHRLHAAMGVSAFSIAVMLALLESLVDFAAGISLPDLEHGDRLTVFIRTGDAETDSEFPTEKKAAPALSQEEIVSAGPVDRGQEPGTISSPELPADSQPVNDWRAIAKVAARASVDDYLRNEESRAEMWRQTRSIMFQADSGFVVKEEEPVISDFRFRPQIHVVGLGVAIGSCFIGIPIAGVPVEQRTVAINLFVCAKDSG